VAKGTDAITAIKQTIAYALLIFKFID